MVATLARTSVDCFAVVQKPRLAIPAGKIPSVSLTDAHMVTRLSIGNAKTKSKRRDHALMVSGDHAMTVYLAWVCQVMLCA